MTTILVVDDEPQIHRFLKPALEAAGFEFLGASDGSEGLRLAAARSPDLVLLDLGLPDGDGRGAIAKLRAFSDVPVIILSARDREADKIGALDEGADDYVEKPFAVGELLARIRASLRRRRRAEAIETIQSAGPITIDTDSREVRANGVRIVLSPREYTLLALLVANAGRVITHRQLLTAVWGPAHADDVQYLRVYVGHLRQKLGAAAACLVTEPGVGYRLVEPETP